MTAFVVSVPKKMRPCPDEMVVISFWQHHAEKKIFFWAQEGQVEKLEDSRSLSSASSFNCWKPDRW